MDELDRHVVKTALATLRAAGGAGLTKAALLSQMDLAAGAPTDSERREAAFAMLRDRGWMDCHLEPVWHDRRWTLTERGMAALEAM